MESNMDESEQYEKICQPQLERIEQYTKQIFRILEGNGGTGLVSEVARHDERLKALNSWKKWAIGFGSSIILLLLTYILTRGGK